MKIRTALLHCVLSVPAVALAQQAPYAFPTPAAGVTVLSDVEYGKADATTLAMDVYRPPGSSARRPALIFFNRAAGADRKWDFYASWARTAR